MARRYFGDTGTVYITYNDDVTYSGSIVVDGHRWAFDELRPPVIGLGSKVAFDSPEAYDKMAQSAISFGSYYSSDNRGDDAPDWAPTPEAADAINDNAWPGEDDFYDIRRKKSF